MMNGEARIREQHALWVGFRDCERPGTRGFVPKGSKGIGLRNRARYNLVELTTSSYSYREPRGISRKATAPCFSALSIPLSGGTKQTRDYANKLGKPLRHIHADPKERIFNPGSHRFEIQALTDLLSSNKVGTREPEI
jgi:hypothetical protein